MKDSLRLVCVLTLICAGAGLLLAVADRATRQPIADAAASEQAAAIRAVLPACDNDPLAAAVTAQVENATWVFYPAVRDGTLVGAAFASSSPKGYGGSIDIMVGIDGATVNAIRVLAHKETPGLGARIVEDAFLGQFAGRDRAGTAWAVRKDGGEIDEITAATISSRAVTAAVAEGLRAYLAAQPELERCTAAPATTDRKRP
jgi:electron transport complex protein RnfG